MELNSQYIGNLIKSLRIHAGLTQHQLAECIGVGNKTVSKWEQGRGIPDISLLPRLSLILNTDIESILAGNIDDLGKEWIGVICTDGVAMELMSGRPVLEYLISMFLLVGIRNIVLIAPGDQLSESEKLLIQYQRQGILEEVYCTESFETLSLYIDVCKKHFCLLHQPAFLYGMHLTRYMQRAMLGKRTTVLALRQGKDSFMPGICFDNKYSCVVPLDESCFDYEWYMFPMLFCHGNVFLGYMEWVKDFTSDRIEIRDLLKIFKVIYVETMERGMLAFSLSCSKDRMLAGEVLSGIEKSQHIKIGRLEEIMTIRGWT